MNLSDMRDFVRRVLNEEGESSGFYSDTELNSYINEAYKELIRIHPVPDEMHQLYSSEDTTTVSGTASYALPDDLFRLLWLKYGNYFCNAVEYMSVGANGGNRNFTASTIFPSYYRLGSNFVVSPTPTATGTTMTVAYLSIPDLLEDDSDAPEINAMFHEIICNGALERAKIKDNEFEEGGYHYSRMKKALYSMYGLLTPEEQAALRSK